MARKTEHQEPQQQLSQPAPLPLDPQAYIDQWRTNTEQKLLHDLFAFRAAIENFVMTPDFRITIIRHLLTLTERLAPQEVEQ